MAQKLEGESIEVTEVVEIPAEDIETTPPTASTLYPAYVRTLQEADEVLHRYENNTKSRFCVWRSPKNFGHSGLDTKKKKVYWDEFALESNVKEKVENGVPFVLMGKKIFDCHHGKDRSLAMKKRAEQRRIELNEKKKRNMSQPGKKLNCPTQVVFTEVVLFPEYKLASNTQYSRKQASKTLKGHVKDGQINLDNLDRRIYLSLPDSKTHAGHPVGEGSESCERMHNKVSDRIAELVAEGVTGAKEMKRRLDVFVRTQLCPELWKPCHSNRRYYPTKGVIRNKMYNAYIKRRLVMIDQVIVVELMKEWQTKYPKDQIFFRPYDEIDEVRLHAMSGISVEEELEDELKIRQNIAKQQMIFVHQTLFQSNLLKRYGNHVCFLDPVYRTTKHALPIFFLTVKTNVDYQVVATFVVQDESKGSTKEALELLKSWNPHWEPKMFMVDNDTEEISALEEVFSDCKVFISDFHREQAWERWLAHSTNGMTPYKEAILMHLQRLAKASSTQQFDKVMKALTESDLWNDNFGKVFRVWFENTWLSVKERWIWFFKVDSVTNVLTTNNTFECQKKDFEHEQLLDLGDKSLCEIITILLEIYIPSKRDSYFEQNAELDSTSTNYNNLPEFFRNRPRRVIEHITERITSSYDISTDDITVHSYKEGEFLVNCRRSDVEYKLHFGNSEKFPHCECEDWSRTMLPCKHFVAIMRDFKEWNWARFPESYRSSPYLTLDNALNPTVGPNLTEVNPNIADVHPNTPDVNPNTPEVNPNAPGVNPNTPEVNPTTPEVDPNAPEVNPNTPEVNPTTPEVDPNAPEVNPNTPEVTPNTSEDPPNAAEVNAASSESAETSQGTISVLDSSQFQELTMPKLSTKSKSGMCRELLNDINNFTYTLSDDGVINRLNAALEEVLTDMRLAFVDDEVIIVEDLIESKTIKSEEKPKGPDKPSKKTKRSSSSSQKESQADEPEAGEPQRKLAKIDSTPNGQTNVSFSGGETIEEPVLEEMNHLEILNIDYYRSLNAEGGTPGNSDRNTSDTQEPKENGSDAALVNASQTSEAQGESTLYKAMELSQLDVKKDGDVGIADTKTPSTLPKHEARLVQRNEMLTVDSINLAQSLLHEMFPHLKGLQNVFHGAVQAFLPVTGDFVQILHDGNLHWVCTSNVSFVASKDPASISMYDSMNQGYVAKFTKQQLASFLCIQNSEMKVILKSVQQQTSPVDCGVFAIAFATALAFGEDPSKQRFDVSKMRPHLVECLKTKKMSPFPEMKIGVTDIVLSRRKFFTIELFCSCRMPYEKPKSEADLMAQCGNCKEWFHQRCEKIALEIFKASGVNFFCAACLKRV